MPVHAERPTAALRQTLGVLRRFRHRLAESADAYVAAVGQHDRRGPGVTLSTEVIPLADACLFLERSAYRLLRPKKLRSRRRPLWLLGVDAQVRREPYGRVVVIGPGNFPLFLPGAQVLQALTAGNTVEVKPAPGCSAAMRLLREQLVDCGLAPERFTVLGESVHHAEAAVDRADLVVATGSFATGQAILRRCAERATPCLLELSGCDAMAVLDSADLDAAVASLCFGLALNGSQVCIAPRRVFVAPTVLDAFCDKLRAALPALPKAPVPGPALASLHTLAEHLRPPIAKLLSPQQKPADPMAPIVWRLTEREHAVGGIDVFAPWAVVCPAPQEDAQWPEVVHRGGYRLGVSIWGERRAAEALAHTLDVGSVVINDVVAPTADPRLPFEGRGRSGYGPTRGAEGLLAMTRTQAVSARRLRFYPHFDPPTDAQAQVLRAGLRLAHGSSLFQRLAAIPSLMRAARQTRADPKPADPNANPTADPAKDAPS
ncbi:MAG: aldehyde dehydrogenase family protein [Planctomycetota bacterium]